MNDETLERLVNSWVPDQAETETTSDIKEGDIVEFMMNGGTAAGSVEHVMVDGYFGVPGSKFYAKASPKNPAVLIRIWENGEETELMTGRMSDEITKI